MHEWTLVAESYCHKCKNATVFQYIHARFLLCACHGCVYVTAMKLKSSNNATMAFVSYAISLLRLAEMSMQLICMQAIVARTG